jgi:hypothetical protein
MLGTAVYTDCLCKGRSSGCPPVSEAVSFFGGGGREGQCLHLPPSALNLHKLKICIQDASELFDMRMLSMVWNKSDYHFGKCRESPLGLTLKSDE